MSTPSTALLRGLVLTNVALLFLGMLMIFLSSAMVPATEESTLGIETTEPTASVWLACVVVVTLLPAYLAGLLGVFLFKNWGRWLTLWVLVLVFTLELISSLFDVSTQWGFPTAIARVDALVSGVMFGLIFFSPLASQFNSVEPATA